MSSLKGLASIAKGLSAEPSPELVQELSPEAEFNTRSQSKAKTPIKRLAKTKDLEYKRVMVLVRKSTEKAAYRKWEDSNPTKDFSDLVESLLSRYALGHISA